jgi:ABC-type uncharacterized transport system substrate-binding protein
VNVNMLHLKKTVFQPCCVALLTLGLFFAPPVSVAAASKPWRIAMIVGGPTFEYQIALQGFAERLAELGIIAAGAVPLPDAGHSLAPMWQWLAENAGGDTIRFMADAFYSPEWNPDRRLEVKKDLLERLDRGDIDCVLALGTWGGQDIGLEPLQIPVLVFSASNAVEAGIIPSPDDSGRDNLLAVVEPGRYKNQVRIFHNLIGFSKLGIVYEDTASSRSSIALKEIEAAAGEAGVELMRCVDVFDIEEADLAVSRLRTCHEDFVKQGADAVYLTFNRGLSDKSAAHVLEPLIKACLPTFAQEGSFMVKRGALLSMTNDASGKGEGFFAAGALEKILGGSPPRSLSQRHESTVSLAVNLRTAARIGWNLPMEILAAVDEFYRDF